MNHMLYVYKQLHRAAPGPNRDCR